MAIDVEDPNHKTTVGILHCGDMGSAIGRLLRQTGIRVVTTCENRSRTTEERARSSGIEILPRLDDIVEQSDVVFSLVLPTAAVELAHQYATRHSLRNGRSSIFLEANTIGLDALEQIRQLLADHGIPLVDAAIHGGAHRMADLGVLYLSGPAVGQVEEICRRAFRVSHLGERIGSATGMKLVMAGMSKTLAATFLEIGILAERIGMLEQFLENCRHFYPGIMSVVERTLPTYSQHAVRRVDEMRDIVKLAESSRLQPFMTPQACELIKILANIDWERLGIGPSSDPQTIIHAAAQACRT